MLDKLLAGMIRCGTIDSVDLVDAIESTLLQVQIETEAAGEERITTLQNCLSYWKGRVKQADESITHLQNRIVELEKANSTPVSLRERVDHLNAWVNIHLDKMEKAQEELRKADGNPQKVEQIVQTFFRMSDTWGTPWGDEYPYWADIVRNRQAVMEAALQCEEEM